MVSVSPLRNGRGVYWLAALSLAATVVPSTTARCNSMTAFLLAETSRHGVISSLPSSATRRKSAFSLASSSSTTSIAGDDDATTTTNGSPDYKELPLDFPRRSDVLVALQAVRQACTVTLALQPSTAAASANDSDGTASSSTISTVSKVDLSPVTVGDFAAQAIVLHHLQQAFPEDSFIAEENSQALEEDETLAKEVMKATGMANVDSVKKSIDLGKEYELWDKPGGHRPPRVWCLDPIDGTRGFLRGKEQGGQYCVALALLENGVPTIGVLGCPNLPSRADDFSYAWNDNETAANNKDSRGCLFVATKAGGCYQLPFIPGGAPAKKLHVTPSDGSSSTLLDPSQGRFCIGVEKFSDALGQCARTAEIVQGDGALTADGEIIQARRIDSQAKYGVLARAGAEYYVRLPKPGYVEWIWDHAAGNVVLTEAGGKMTDTDGNDIDFSLGAKMSESVRGVMGSNGGKFHSVLIEAFQQQELERTDGSS